MFNELERTPGTAAVSGVYGREPVGVDLSPAGIPWTNSKPFAGVNDPENGGYLEPIANVSFCAQTEPDTKLDITSIIPWLSANCEKTGWFVAGECEDGHRFAKEIVCGKEWCPRCGEVDSVAHNRRFARWLPKIQQMESVGYFVLTLPESTRSEYRTKEDLAALGHHVQELLKSYGFSRGLRRWHFFGDQSTKWHPHLNVLVDGGYISPEQLEYIKADYAWLINAPMADVYYRYGTSPGQMVHTLKYVARATFRDYRWDPRLAVELRGFRNIVTWGGRQWTGEPTWALSDLAGTARAAVSELDIKAVESLSKGLCPVCDKKLTWGEALPIGLLKMAYKAPLGAGYYRLAGTRAPPPLPEAIETSLWQLEYLASLSPDVRQCVSRGFQDAHRRFALRKAARLEDLESLWQRWNE